MKRDLQINYGILDDIIAQLHKYQGSLEDMRSALLNIDSFVQTNHGESIDAWRDKIKNSELNIKEYETQINDLLTLFEDYVNDTTSIISPIARNAIMRVDRNDIYHNLKQLENGISNNIPKAISKTYKSPGREWFDDPTDEEKANSRYNEGRIENIRADIQSTKSRLDSKMDQLWDLYNSKVKRTDSMRLPKHWSILLKIR
ncbi:hypothetical protein [Salirhabdus sp. Marseille-P4669]|uniref:hypothetical protein n=1 Tax=Salirhabdus sp. Marseille-P4669 TaxID=2042310 RepID=UPI000C7BB3C7|nr:hypothetical protein [Salirhabdus sp. Marseille-P4669]